MYDTRNPTTRSRAAQTAGVAVVFLASDANRHSINALTGAIEQDGRLSTVQLSFPHPRVCQVQIASALEEVGPAGVVVIAFSFMTSALIKTDQQLQQLLAAFAPQRDRLLFVAGGPHPSGDAAGTLALGFDVVFIGDGEGSFTEFLARLPERRGDLRDLRGIAVLGTSAEGVSRVLRTGRAPAIELGPRYPSIGLRHNRLGPVEIGRGCPHACGFCQITPLNGARMRHRPLEDTLTHIEHLVRAGFKDIRFITPDLLAYLSDDGVHPHYGRLEHALIAMREVAGGARIKFGEFPSEARPEHLTPELVQLLNRYTDAAHFTIGAQSGSERMLEAMHRQHDVAAVVRAVEYLARYYTKLRKIYVDFIAGLPNEKEEDQEASLALMERLTSISPKVCIHAHTFMPLPGTALAKEPPGSVGQTMRDTFALLAKRGQEWGNWEDHEQIAAAIHAYHSGGQREERLAVPTARG
jgi:B12-binding domain/radical SAM domain protein